MSTIDLGPVVTFAPERWPNGVRAQLAKASALWPAVGMKSRAAPLKACRALQLRVRDRVRELHECPWVGGESDPAQQRLLSKARNVVNCRPAFFVPAQGNLSCGLAAFCPRCWAREVQGVYDRLAYRLFDDPALPEDGAPTPPRAGRRLACASRVARAARTQAPRDRPRSPYDLIERTLTYPAEASQFVIAPGRPGAGGRLLRPLVLRHAKGFEVRVLADQSVVKAGRPPEFAAAKRLGVLGGIERLAFGVIQARGERRPHWRVRCRQLLVVPHDWDEQLPSAAAWLPCPRMDGEWGRLRRPTRVELANAVARWGRYDAMLLRADPARVAEVLSARFGVKTTATFGICRGAIPAPAARDE
jgi:hypothetical protein